MYKNSILNDILSKQLRYNAYQINSLLNDPIIDRSLGALFGSFVGDALGSYCEFSQTQLTDYQIQQVMKMKGGGTFPIKAGQLTDDSQMALHLLRGLNQYDSSLSLESQIEIISQSIATEYVYWLESQPFDIGGTCYNGLSILRKYRKIENKIKYQTLKQKCFPLIKIANEGSLSNGSLMRIVPLSIFNSLIRKHRQGQSNKMDILIQNEIRMTHSKQLAIQCGKQWVQLISDLIVRSDDSYQQISNIFQAFMNKNDSHNELKLWKKQSLGNQLMEATINQGYCKIAFCYGLHWLNRIIQNKREQKLLDQEGNQFKNIMRNIIRMGGDSDTNGAIVGGLIGSMVGFKGIPSEYTQQLLNLRLLKLPSLQKYQRYSFYEPKTGLIQIFKLFQKFK